MMWTTGLIGAAGCTAYYWWQRSLSDDPVAKMVGTLKKPVFETFLPDKVDDPKHPRPYTLVVDLDKFLVHHVWDYDLGRWRVAKRPGAELFLFYAAQLYEVVLFSSMQHFDGDSIVRKLDPFGCITFALYRFATKHENGRYVKDLTVLNRDLAKTVVIGHDADGFCAQPENVLLMKPWMGDPDDRLLEEAVDFLEGLALSRSKDVRPIVKQFTVDQHFFPSSYDQLQERVYEQLRSESRAKEDARRKNIFFKLFGGPRPIKSLELSYWQKKEERMNMRRKEWAHVRALMQKQLDEVLAKEKEYYKEHKMPLWDLFNKGPPPPPPIMELAEEMEK